MKHLFSFLLFSFLFLGCVSKPKVSLEAVEIDTDRLEEIRGTYTVQNDYGTGELNLAEDLNYSSTFITAEDTFQNTGTWSYFYMKTKGEEQIVFSDWVWYFPKTAMDHEFKAPTPANVENLDVIDNCLSFAGLSEDKSFAYCKP